MKYEIAFGSKGQFSFNSIKFVQNVIIFSADKNQWKHSENVVNNILILGKEQLKLLKIK